MPLNAGLLVAVLVAISIGALLKGMTGLGLPLFGVPALAAITSVEEAVVLMIIPGIGANLWMAVSHRKYKSLLKEHKPFLASGFVGGLAGTTLLLVLDDRWLKLILATWLGLYLMQYFFNKSSLKLFHGPGHSSYLLGAAAGTIQGATGISAQIVAPYYHGRSLPPPAYAFLVTFTFLLFASAQVGAAFTTELLTPARLQLSLAALVPTLIFTRVGIHFANVISHAVFNKVLLVVFCLMEIKLVADIF
ncbi:MAG: sulfite exporter TauE/SafE family protein [Gammaproteobacteria bacterium]|nr:sulfite exporter TauE/SafE family protein [Gammaproteobacteria bacterium]